MASELSSFIDEELKKKRLAGEAETARLVTGALDVEVRGARGLMAGVIYL